MTCGIYLITNKINGHMYVGQSNNIERRFDEHKKGRAANRQPIDRAILKYGEDNFNYQIVTKLPLVKSILDAHEKYWISFYNTFKDAQHYNLTPGGGFSPMYIPEIVKKVSESMKGKKFTDEHKQKLSESHKGKPLSEEHKKKISESIKGENNPRGMLGKHHSDETKKKISENNARYWLGKKFSEETRQKMAETKKGENHYNWKPYARILKYTDKRINQGYTYRIKFNGKIIKENVDLFKLINWFQKEYPTESLHILINKR